MQEDWDILFDNYLENRLSNAEKLNFEQRYLNDISFKTAFQEHEQTIENIKQYSRLELKASLVTIGSNLQKSNEFDDYKANKSGTKLSSIIKWLFLTGSIAGLASIFYFNKNSDIKHEIIDYISKWNIDSIWIEKININQEVKYDTVWHTIKSDKLENGTIIIQKPSGDESYGTEKLENNSKKVMYDTIYHTKVDTIYDF